MTSISFRIYGIPAPGGSKNVFRHPRTGQTVVVDAGRGNAKWKRLVAKTAQLHAPRKPLEGPLSLVVEFIMPRPKSHYGTGSNSGKVKARAPQYPIGKPDTTKLLRSTEDALAGLWHDDAQVVEQRVAKYYGDSPGALVVVSKIDGGATR
jgi:Holliday junction resolvase RusA-like endonuclease